MNIPPNRHIQKFYAFTWQSSAKYDELYGKSRAAILRIGAKQEGNVRHEQIMPDGRKRNSVRFSIIDSEWANIKNCCRKRLNNKVGQRFALELKDRHRFNFRNIDSIRNRINGFRTMIPIS